MTAAMVLIFCRIEKACSSDIADCRNNGDGNHSDYEQQDNDCRTCKVHPGLYRTAP